MNNAEAAARRAERSDALDHAVRIGLVAYGLVHLLIGVIAARLALGDRSGSADSTGALKTLAAQPFGAALVWAVAVGLALLVVWRLVEIVGSDEAKEWFTRGLRAVLYAVLAYSAVRVATSGGGGSGGNTEETMTAQVLQWPAGRWLVVAAGLAIIGYGVGLAWRGLTRKHAEHLATEGRTGSAGRAYVVFGAVGHVAKGAALAVVGGLVVHAGLTHDPDSAGGLDEALQAVLQQPLGPVLLLAVALGIACYGVFCFARARHLSR